MVVEEFVCQQHRKNLKLPEARLASAILQQAFEDLTLYPTVSNSKWEAATKHSLREDARQWLLDTTSQGPHSLRQVCWVLTISTGIEIHPEQVADACRRGVVLSNENCIRRGPGFNMTRRIRAYA